MPMVDIFLAVAAEEAAVAAAATAAAEITAAEAAAQAAASSALEGTAAAGLGAEFGAQGILGAESMFTPAQLGADVIAGGQGAGAPGINQAMVNAQQAQAVAPGAGYTPADINNAFAQINTEMMANPSPYTPVGQPYAQAPTSDAIISQTMTPPAQVPLTPNTVTPGIPGTMVQPGYLSSPTVSAPANTMLYPGQGAATSTIGANSGAATVAPGSSIKSGWDAVTGWMSKNPMTSALGIYGVLNATGALKPQNTSFGEPAYNGPLLNYRLSPNFTTYPTGPNTNIYRPRYAEGGILQAGGPVEEMSHRNVIGNNLDYPGAQNFSSAFSNSNAMPVAEPVVKTPGDVNITSYTGQQLASGGIVAFAGGGGARSYSDLEKNMNMYSKMLNNPASASPPPSRPDMGIFTDSNPNTRKLSAPDAAQYYQNALANRYGIRTGAGLPKSSMGRVNTSPAAAKQKKEGADDIEAAAGGIMQAQRYNLGGYASGGNPRLLRGPGDGMSDNIPATIAGKQPARLADGEFVIPADVVSGLGNGSTEAGAKHLHQMMDKVRMARTGTKKQGKQINASKFTRT
jgi:hypothetical protein